MTINETDRDTAIRLIRSALLERSGRPWSVTGGRGTAWGWITITAPPARRGGQFGPMSPTDRVELAALLRVPTVHDQGVDIPASGDYRREYVARAHGQTPAVYGVQYWD